MYYDNKVFRKLIVDQINGTTDTIVDMTEFVRLEAANGTIDAFSLRLIASLLKQPGGIEEESEPVTIWIGNELSVGYWRGEDLHRLLQPALICGDLREWWVNGREITLRVEAWIDENGFSYDPEEWDNTTKVFWMLLFSR